MEIKKTGGCTISLAGFNVCPSPVICSARTSTGLGGRSIQELVNLFIKPLAHTHKAMFRKEANVTHTHYISDLFVFNHSSAFLCRFCKTTQTTSIYRPSFDLYLIFLQYRISRIIAIVHQEWLCRESLLLYLSDDSFI